MRTHFYYACNCVLQCDEDPKCSHISVDGTSFYKNICWDINTVGTFVPTSQGYNEYAWVKKSCE